ncbi:MAG: helix-turn-helix domain-containing protein [Thermoplasmatales archaeon]
MLGDEGWHMIRNMAENGMRISDIARELNMNRKTVRKYAKSKFVPKYGRREGIEKDRSIQGLHKRENR